MTRIEHLLQHLVSAFSERASGRAAQAGLIVSELQLDLPVEARFAEDGDVLMTLPRGLLATGFSLPHGRLRVTCEELAS